MNTRSRVRNVKSESNVYLSYVSWFVLGVRFWRSARVELGLVYSNLRTTDSRARRAGRRKAEGGEVGTGDGRTGEENGPRDFNFLDVRLGPMV